MSDLRSQILGMMASRVAASWAATAKTAADCSPPTCSDGTPAEYDDGKDAYVCPSTGEAGPNGPICSETRCASPERVSSRFAMQTDDEQLVAVSDCEKLQA